VKYRVAGKQRYRTFDRKRDAEVWEADFKRRRQLGPRLAIEHDRETMTLADYVAGPWRAHAATLAAPTRAKYAWALDKHLGELVDEPLLVIDAPMIAAQQRLLLDRGATPSTVREVIAKLSGILQIATEHGIIPANAARSVRNVPLGDDEHEVTVLSPGELERVIMGLSGRDRAIALLGGHLGLRPREIRLAPWDDFDGETLTIGRSRTKKTARRSRVIAVPQITARELRAWQLESGGRGADPIVGPLTENALKLWARRHLPGGIRATDLRHSHASACHYVRSLTLPAILRRLGHKQQVHFQHYAAVIDQIEETGGARYDSLDELIVTARAAESDSGGRRMVTEAR
jgi:integrase